MQHSMASTFQIFFLRLCIAIDNRPIVYIRESVDYVGMAPMHNICNTSVKAIWLHKHTKSLFKDPGFLFECLCDQQDSSGHNPCVRQLNAKVCNSKFFLLFIFTTFVQTTITQKHSSTHLDFSTKQILITARSFPTTHHLHSLKFTLDDKSHSQHSVAAVRSEGHDHLSENKTSAWTKLRVDYAHGWHGLFPK